MASSDCLGIELTDGSLPTAIRSDMVQSSDIVISMHNVIIVV